ncbi:regulator [Malaciobacter mytili LMG 24559]|uniref:Regulator n=1 Tax=Malaciobacter mytili LMG 24559 TaxID=1032238 RepID=A0AAX2AGP4_9BACT|nr:HD domain-containing phosphohydrolase [Malaciobacter mytili]AXH14239.1 multi-sensor domain-containing response regulator c-di-GMP phosphodiesterase, RpfG family [Malaciobacter mytili LMG 24559]RXK15319.1 regulator [Malaciobacter mytili LMG 24559]
MNKISKKNLTILYVEDEEIIRKEISTILGFIASEVIVASDGEEGLNKFQENKIDLIITDVNMPKLNGFDMLRAIREQSQVPAIILSAFSQPDFIKQANQIDIVNEYLLKPVDITILFDKINKNYEKIKKQREYQEVSKLLEQYKIAVDKSAIVSKSDITGKITYANEQFCKISGYKLEELIGNSHNVVRHPNNSKAFFEDLWNTIKVEKRIWNGRFKNRAKDGTTYVVDATIVPILNTLNEIEEFIAIRFDVTEVEAYKEFLQEKLHSSQEDVQKKIHLVKEYEQMINISASVIRVDINKEITFANDRILQLLNYKEEELLKKELLSIIDKSSLETYNKVFNEVIEKNFWQGVLKLCCNKEKNIYYMDFTFRTIKDIKGNIIEFMGIGKNITETINLYKEIEDTQKDVIFSLGTIGEARSKETGNHVKRVAEYSYLLAKKVGLSEEEAELIKMASPMHDIGKVGIPDAILNKPAKFTPEEFEQMKKHTKIGYDMLKNSNREILKASAIIAYEHHEKWNGQGYPRGLKANEIHIYGRITAIADVFDALGSNRCYKKAWELHRILELFKEEKGKHFDPELIDIFFENLEEFLVIKEKYKDEFDELEVYR